MKRIVITTALVFTLAASLLACGQQTSNSSDGFDVNVQEPHTSQPAQPSFPETHNPSVNTLPPLMEVEHELGEVHAVVAVSAHPKILSTVLQASVPEDESSSFQLKIKPSIAFDWQDLEAGIHLYELPDANGVSSPSPIPFALACHLSYPGAPWVCDISLEDNQDWHAGINYSLTLDALIFVPSEGMPLQWFFNF